MHLDAPEEYKDKWNELRLICENNHGNEQITMQIKKHLTIDELKNMPPLDRSEGGLGTTEKNIRYQSTYHKWAVPATDIYFDRIESHDNNRWTYEELDDIRRAFITVANNYIESNGVVNGCIEIEHPRPHESQC